MKGTWEKKGLLGSKKELTLEELAAQQKQISASLAKLLKKVESNNNGKESP